ncbi:protein kinase domain-containing protein [Streptomyces sp. PTD9-10]|uniref:protein kinase domain-containing protein n=1 Tax=Streptomyces sp. PTD9-10 TaxID=3120151 RepID=UPI00300A6660
MGEGGYPGMMVAGRYRLVGALGAGGFGQVWRARDEQLRVEVAVKAVSLPATGSEKERADLVARAMREARNAARLRTHPNVVAVHDVVTDRAVPWIVMELVEGRSLADELRAAGPLPVARVCEVAGAVLSALEAAHTAGIVHRDVKPANVLLGDDGRVLLADFGIAVREHDTRVTGTGMVIGSLPYLAPERIEQRGDGPAGDLFSLGVTLYEAIEGVNPFQRTTPSESVAAVLAYRVAPPRIASGVSDLVMRLLDRDPTARPTAAAAHALLSNPSQPTAPVTVPVASPPPAPQFGIVFRGYARDQVDEYFAAPPHRRPANPRFELTRRGYDRAQVDEAVRQDPTVTTAQPAYRCAECGAGSPKWKGRCPECQAWGTVEEVSARSTAIGAVSAYRCAECGAGLPKWKGRCPECQAWGTVEGVNS